MKCSICGNEIWRGSNIAIFENGIVKEKYHRYCLYNSPFGRVLAIKNHGKPLNVNGDLIDASKLTTTNLKSLKDF